MAKVIQAFMAVPISQAIGKAFGADTLLGMGAAVVTARIVMRSFPAMVVLGIVAGTLNHMRDKESAKARHDVATRPA
jgi:uncharacterized membrane protein